MSPDFFVFNSEFNFSISRSYNILEIKEAQNEIELSRLII
jgi:hypothetical protein